MKNKLLHKYDVAAAVIAGIGIGVGVGYYIKEPVTVAIVIFAFMMLSWITLFKKAMARK